MSINSSINNVKLKKPRAKRLKYPDIETNCKLPSIRSTKNYNELPKKLD